MKHLFMASPVGELKLVASNIGLCAVLWPTDDGKRVSLVPSQLDERDPILMATKKQLEEYFETKRRSFELPLDLRGSVFQKQVWQQLQAIDYGKTASYLDLACNLGKPTGARAVGMANGRNPISIIIPCHRVIGANGLLTGYAGGIENKKKLLLLEGATFKD